MIHVGDIIFALGDVQSPDIIMLSTMRRYHDTCVGNVQYPHIYHDIPLRYRIPQGYSRYPLTVMNTHYTGSFYLHLNFQ